MIGKIIRHNQVAEYWKLVDKATDPRWPVVWLDFNGVLDQYGGWNGYIQDYPPAERVETFLDNLRTHFRTIGVLSATPYRHVYRWLRKYGLLDKVDFVTNIKLPGALYIDDKGQRFTGKFSHDTALAFMNLHLGAWWENGNSSNTGRQ